MQTGSLIAHTFVEPQKETYLYFIKNFLQFEHILEAIKIFEHKKDDYILFPSSEIFITFKIFCVFNIVPIYNQRMLEGV